VRGRVQQHGAGLGQLQAPAVAVQQLRADELLQPPDLLAQGRLGDEHPLRGVRETTRLRHRHEVPEMPQLNSLRRPGRPRQRYRLGQLCHGHSLIDELRISMVSAHLTFVSPGCGRTLG
jgi:hypothetical protein